MCTRLKKKIFVEKTDIEDLKGKKLNGAKFLISLRFKAVRGEIFVAICLTLVSNSFLFPVNPAMFISLQS